MDIKVLGTGCTRCKTAHEMVKEAVVEAGVDAQIEHITDIKKIGKYGVLSTPAVVVNGDVKCVGKIPEKEEIMIWLGEQEKGQ